MKNSMKPGKFLSNEDKMLVINAIKAAELNTSGEIRVHIETEIKGDVLDRAAYLFEVLKIHKTRERNGVLFYLSEKSRKFAILGDAGINAKVPSDFWDKIKEKMQDRFSEGNFALGLSEGIQMAGEQLKTHFPYQKEDVNELSDEISFGK
jgi:uncharacterized membrane protein